MSTATLPPPVEALPEDIGSPSDNSAPSTAEKSKRGRNSAPTLNYRALHKTKDACKANPPQIEVKDEEGLTTSTEEAKGFRIYKVINTKSKDEVFVYARSSDQALSFVAMLRYTSELQDSQRVGRAKKIDAVYLMYARALKTAGQTKELEQFFKEHPHYREHLATA